MWHFKTKPKYLKPEAYTQLSHILGIALNYIFNSLKINFTLIYYIPDSETNT